MLGFGGAHLEKKLLDAWDYQLINQLSLLAKRRVAGLITGEQRSPVQGGGIEFADYREYQPGDDVRRIDWAVFLRLRRLLVKLCAEEKELTVILILDASRSMQFGEPDKLWLAERLAAILCGIALHDGNRAGVVAMGPRLMELVRPEQSRAPLAGIVNILTQLKPMDGVNPDFCIRQFASRYAKKCMAILVSDLLYPDWARSIRSLAASGCEGYVIQVLAPEELDPVQRGEVTLVDLEGWGSVPLHIDADSIRRYRRELANFLDEVRQTCHRGGLGHTMIPTDAPLARILHHDLTKGGLVC